ncbi:ATP-dependent helicase [Clostridium botulinum]|uniref:DNA 3'-5' helicase n=1 Tax=Clostridium botulinum TaxID=1491 RepID=A0A6B4KAK0_CLOBO|nr:ATP-dependent helicase [Clostridium botulinum]NFD85624.1 ATP-dependent helicase [Clostridium botulinum]NFE08819.1 ATP-dependent helicase [Clostridium botulinum]NFE34909.1 ATP-dependent helicase [Clostridium botulinum]NFE49792.1 ATP-dependent helicase [Clostridium botulinum]
MSRELSSEQKEIFNYNGNTVVIANPGSGKTFIVCEKIKAIIDELLDYEGVIAISYTNKASKELKDRLNNINTKASYFNTLDTFLLMEVVYAFGQHVFENVKDEFKIYDSNDVSNSSVNEEREKLCHAKDDYYNILGGLYRNGIILLEKITDLAIYIIDNSLACRRYLKTRYKYIFIDEYQDCGKEQHSIFLKIISLGIIGVAVGDPNQSIYGFSGKSSKYLVSLVENDKFKSFYLTKNYRSNKAIVDYSLKLLDNKYKVENSELRVFYKKIQGTQNEICDYINNNINTFMSIFSVENCNEIAILVRNDTTGEIVNNQLEINHRYFKTTKLDKNSSLWAGVFKRLLRYKINNENSYEFCTEFFNEDEERFLNLYKKLDELNNIEMPSINYKDAFIELAKLIYPSAENVEAVILLEEVLRDQSLCASYKEADKDELQIMTLHKSKGLEFKVVFHLDLYKYIIPSEGRDRNGVWGYIDLNQCLNLHYVGITRAIDACVILTSTFRYNGKGMIKDGIDSDFLIRNGVNNLRNNYKNLDEVAITK